MIDTKKYICIFIQLIRYQVIRSCTVQLLPLVSGRRFTCYSIHHLLRNLTQCRYTGVGSNKPQILCSLVIFSLYSHTARLDGSTQSQKQQFKGLIQNTSNKVYMMKRSAKLIYHTNYETHLEKETSSGFTMTNFSAKGISLH